MFHRAKTLRPQRGQATFSPKTLPVPVRRFFFEPGGQAAFYNTKKQPVPENAFLGALCGSTKPVLSEVEGLTTLSSSKGLFARVVFSSFVLFVSFVVKSEFFFGCGAAPSYEATNISTFRSP
jgi:hypothetical protein